MRPPSAATTTFVGDRLNTSASPKPPTRCPACSDPNACAASKNNRRPFSVRWRGAPPRRTASRRCASRGSPRCACRPSADRVRRQRQRRRSISANTGRRPFHCDGVRGGGERERGHDHVTGELGRAKHQHETGRARGHRDAVAHPQVPGRQLFEPTDERTVRQDPAPEDRLHFGPDPSRVGDTWTGQRKALRKRLRRRRLD